MRKVSVSSSSSGSELMFHSDLLLTEFDLREVAEVMRFQVFDYM
jgi:hypothetical protein